MPYRPRTHRPNVTRARQPEQRLSSCQRGYDRHWQKFRLWFLSQPENAICQEKDCRQPATEVHHVNAPRGDRDRFYDGPFLALCKPCHSKRTAKGE